MGVNKSQVFIAKLDSNGNAVWVKRTSSTDVYNNSPFTDFDIHSGHIYVSGYHKALSNTTIGNATFFNNTNYDAGFLG